MKDCDKTDPMIFMHLASKTACQRAAEMADDIKAAIHKHDDTIPLALALGVLKIVGKELLDGQV